MSPTEQLDKDYRDNLQIFELPEDINYRTAGCYIVAITNGSSVEEIADSTVVVRPLVRTKDSDFSYTVRAPKEGEKANIVRVGGQYLGQTEYQADIRVRNRFFARPLARFAFKRELRCANAKALWPAVKNAASMPQGSVE